MLVALFTVIALIAATRVLESDSIGAWAAIAVAGALGLYAVPVMLYPLGGRPRMARPLTSRRPWPVQPLLRRLASASSSIAVLTLVLYSPVFAASGIRSVTSNEFVEPRSWATSSIASPTTSQDTFSTWDRDLPLVVSVGLLVGLVGSLVLTPFLSRYPIPPLVAALAWILPVVVVQRVVPFTRVWLSLCRSRSPRSPRFYGSLLERMPRSRRSIPVAAALVAIGAAWTVTRRGLRPRVPRDRCAARRARSRLLSRATRRARRRIFATGLRHDPRVLPRATRASTRDPSSTRAIRTRATFLVVNLLGGQRLADYLRELDASLDAARARSSAFALRRSISSKPA